MVQTEDRNVNDAMLVAYLDEELDAFEKHMIAQKLEQDAALKERLSFLKRGERLFGQAFDLLLDAAPDEKLQSMFSAIIAGDKNGTSSDTQKTPNIMPRPREARQLWRIAATVILAAAAFAGGMFADFLLRPDQRIQQTRGWREAVAQYVSLFSPATLEGMPVERTAQAENLSRISVALGLNLTVEKVAVPSLSFKGTQLLQLDGKPIAQIAYLKDGRVPVTFCIIKSAQPVQAVAMETRHGLNIQHWTAGGYGFMVIGDAPPNELTEIAGSLRARFG
jgi:anti-sigma factor RsiW